MDAQIYLLNNKKKGHVYELIMELSDVPEKQYEIPDLIIENFKQLNLPQSEKSLLSFEARRQVRAYLDLERNWLEIMAEKLIKRINKLRRKVIHLQANNIGSFICLYALKYFKLSNGKELILHLSDCPLRLFEKYVAHLGSELGDRINCQVQKSSWLYPYETLYLSKVVPSLKKSA